MTTMLRWLVCGFAVFSSASWANGLDVQGVLGQIQSNYDKAIQEIPSSGFSKRDNQERDRLRELKSRDLSQMQSTLKQYSGSSQKGGSGSNGGGRVGEGSIGKGFYEFIRYRDNDPFLFCTDGQDPEKFPDRCWWPVAPFTGAFMMNPICRPPNPYGKDWTSEDWDSLGQYLSVCPMAGGKSGAWSGKNGKQPNMVPNKH